jgi:hypothetical protein
MTAYFVKSERKRIIEFEKNCLEKNWLGGKKTMVKRIDFKALNRNNFSWKNV